MTEETEDKKDPTAEEHLEDLLDETEEVGDEIAAAGQELNEQGTFVADHARTFKAVIKDVPAIELGPTYEYLVDGLTMNLVNLHQVKDGLESLPVYATTGTSSASAIYTSDAVVDVITFRVDHPIAGFSEAVSDFEEVIDRTASMESVIALMENLGLDESHKEDEVPALELYKTSIDALNKPVTDDLDPVITSYIPMREAIETTLDHLLHKASGAKVEPREGKNTDWRKLYAVSMNLKHFEIPDNQVQGWANEWMALKKVLSEGKGDAITRDEWRRVIRKATLFLIGFLTAINPTNLKSD